MYSNKDPKTKMMALTKYGCRFSFKLCTSGVSLFAPAADTRSHFGSVVEMSGTKTGWKADTTTAADSRMTGDSRIGGGVTVGGRRLIYGSKSSCSSCKDYCMNRKTKKQNED